MNKSVEDDSEISVRGEKFKFTIGQLWSVPKPFIQRYGSSAANVLSVLCKLQCHATEDYDGKKWFFCPIGSCKGRKSKSPRYRPLVRKIPFLSFSSITKLITGTDDRESLESKGAVLIRRKSNQLKGDKTLRFHVPDKIMREWSKEDNFRWYDPSEAMKFGLAAALVLNVIYREFSLRLPEGQQYLIFNKYAIAQDLGLPRSTVRDVFTKLKESRYLASYQSSEGEAFKLMVPCFCKVKGNGYGRKNVARPISVQTVTTVQNPTASHLQTVKKSSGKADLSDDLSKLVESTAKQAVELKTAKEAKKKVRRVRAIAKKTRITKKQREAIKENKLEARIVYAMAKKADEEGEAGCSSNPITRQVPPPDIFKDSGRVSVPNIISPEVHGPFADQFATLLELKYLHWKQNHVCDTYKLTAEDSEACMEAGRLCLKNGIPDYVYFSAQIQDVQNPAEYKASSFCSRRALQKALDYRDKNFTAPDPAALYEESYETLMARVNQGVDPVNELLNHGDYPAWFRMIATVDRNEEIAARYRHSAIFEMKRNPNIEYFLTSNSETLKKNAPRI